MAKNPEQSAEKPAAGGQAPPADPAQQQQRQQVEVTDEHSTAAYANFCRVTGTPEELILDFGLNPQPFGTPTSPISINQRIIMNFYTAKRMMAALSMALQRHEAAFGVLETDVQKRVVPGALRQQSGGGAPASSAKSGSS